MSNSPHCPLHRSHFHATAIESPDALGGEAVAVIAPIMDRTDFEHLEAKGIMVLKKMAARQRRRRK